MSYTCICTCLYRCRYTCLCTCLYACLYRPLMADDLPRPVESAAGLQTNVPSRCIAGEHVMAFMFMLWGLFSGFDQGQVIDSRFFAVARLHVIQHPVVHCNHALLSIHCWLCNMTHSCNAARWVSAVAQARTHHLAQLASATHDGPLYAHTSTSDHEENG